MLAASAQVTAASPATSADPTAAQGTSQGASQGASSTPDGVDGFTSALAALMAVLGQAAPAPDPTAAAAPASGAGGSVAGGAPVTPFFVPRDQGAVDPNATDTSQSAPADGATPSAAADPAAQPTTPDPAASDVSAAVLQALLDRQASPTATTPTLQPTPAPTPKAVDQAEATADATSDAATGAAPATQGASAAADVTAFAALLPPPDAGLGDDDAAAAPAASPAPLQTASVSVAIDPRLLRFTARSTPAPATPPTTSKTDPAAGVTDGTDSTDTQTAATANDASNAAPTDQAADAAANPQASPAAALPVSVATLPAMTLAAPVQTPTPIQPLGAVDRGKATKAQAATSAITPAAPKAAASLVAQATPQISRGDDDAFSLTGAAGGPSHPGDDTDAGDDAGPSANAAGPDASAAQAMTQGAPAAMTSGGIPPAAAALASAHGAQITAQLASQISARASAQRSAFDFALEPQGLGRVDVSLKIDQQGQLSAVLSFDNPAAAAEAKGRSADLQQALQQAGFNLPQGSLSFTSGGGQGHAAWQGQQASGFAASAAAASLDAGLDPLPLIRSAASASSAGGLDITI